MGNPRGFLDIDRKDPVYRSKKERVLDFNEVEVRLSDKEVNEQAARCMDCGIPFCHGAGCPLANVIPEWNDMVYNGHWEDALKLLLSTNNFPEFTGRICPAPCEAACTVGLDGDPVAIRQIELALVEKGFETGLISPVQQLSGRSGKCVAVVGSGPSGLAVADCLNKSGHNVIVYEKNANPGGLLRYGIPDFKLAKNIIERRVELMKREGVIFETSIEVGNDISGDYLAKKFDAVAITSGAETPRDLPVSGRDLKGVYFAMEFLGQQNRSNSGEKFLGKKISAEGKNVVVIGGGDTGSDCVGTSIRQGASSVTQIEIMPKPPEERSEFTPWPQWPYQLRTSSSHKEGCERKWNIKSVDFEGESGKIVKINAIEVKWEFDAQGRPVKMADVEGSEFSLDADLVFLAMGFTGVTQSGLVNDLNLKLDQRGNIATDEKGMSSRKGVFAAGDAASGASLVVRAIASGRKLAGDIDCFLKSL